MPSKRMARLTLDLTLHNLILHNFLTIIIHISHIRKELFLDLSRFFLLIFRQYRSEGKWDNLQLYGIHQRPAIGQIINNL